METCGSGMTRYFEALAKKIRQQPDEETNDYVQDGLLYCGRCRTPREYIMEIGGRAVRMPVACECRMAAERARAKREQAECDMRVVEKLRQCSMMDGRFSTQTFSTFKRNADNAKIFNICKRYADKFDEMREHNQGLLFFGGVGTGKSYAAACIANELLSRRVPVVMTSFVKLLEDAKKFSGKDDELIADLNRAQLLILDDLGAERGSEFALERVYDIVDSRYRAKLPMILTTNLTMAEMKDTPEIRRARIYDRIFEVCYPVKFAGKSFRKEEANRRFREMRAFLEDGV